MISQSELIELNKLEPKFERGDAVLLDSTSCVVLGIYLDNDGVFYNVATLDVVPTVSIVPEIRLSLGLSLKGK
jgi:hypothetical protein